MKRLVPSQYSTIQSAINACSAGDVVVISAGTYAENLDLSAKTKIVVRAAFGEAVIVAPPSYVSGTVKCAVKLDGATKVVLRDLTINIPTTCDVAVGYDATPCLGISILDCIFNAGAPGGSYPFGAFVRVGPGTGDRTTIIRRCLFNGVLSGAVADRAVDFAIRIEGTSGDSLVELCSFTYVHYRNPLSGIFSGGTTEAATVLVYLSSAGSSRTVIRNCTGYQTIDRNWIRVAATGSTIQVYNNMLYGSPNNSHIFTIQCSSGAYVGYNSLYDPSSTYSSSFSFTPNTEFNTVTVQAVNPGHSTQPSLVYVTGAAYRTGTRGSYCPVNADYFRYMFTDTPSRGCNEWKGYDDIVHALHLKYINVNIVDGLIVYIQDSGSPTGERRSYNSPFEVAKHLEVLIGDLNLSSDVSVWYDHTTNRYGMQTYPETYFGIETARMSKYLLGTPSA